MHCLRIAAALNMVSVGRLPSIDRSNAFLHIRRVAYCTAHTRTRATTAAWDRACASSELR